MLQEGINEAGAMGGWIAAGHVLQRPTACTMMPFYIYYSMFGFQRIGDLILGGRRHAARAASSWAAPPAAPR